NVIHLPHLVLNLTSKTYCTIWLRFFMTVMHAGAATTTITAGKMKNTSGGTNLIVVLAAISSAFWRRCVRKASEKFPSDLEIGVPNLSVWISMATNDR